MFDTDQPTNMVIAHFGSHSEEDLGNDCSLSHGNNVSNVENRSASDQGCTKEVSSEVDESRIGSTTNVKTIEPESPIVVCSNDCIFKSLFSKLIIPST